jgi:O-methyltransferase
MGDRYLDLLARCLTGMIHGDPPVDPWHGVLRDDRGAVVSAAGAGCGTYTVEPGVYDPAVREMGGDWPATAETMIGLRRLENLRGLIENVVTLGTPGDFLEAGVWRGGACIFMRGVLASLGVHDRRIFAADSFEGLPLPTCPQDERDVHAGMSILRVSLEDVQRNFRRFDLLDDQVVFLKGLFKNTLPIAPIKQLAILRIDGDMYGSTTDVLTALYHKVVSGGFCVIDDFNLPPVVAAVQAFLGDRRVDARIIDRTGIYWRKE